MNTGWVRFCLPEGLEDLGCWSVRIGETVAQLGELVAAPTGTHLLTVQAILTLPNLQAAATLRAEVEVEQDSITEVGLPCTVLLTSQPACGLLRLAMGIPA